MEKKIIDKKSCLRPMPFTVVTCKGSDGRTNAIPVYYCSNVSYDPPMVQICINPSRFSHHLIKETGVFVINLPSTDQYDDFKFFGRTSGSKVDKLKNMRVADATKIDCPILCDFPINIECRVINSIMTGSHEMFIAEVLEVHQNISPNDDDIKMLLGDLSLI